MSASGTKQICHAKAAPIALLIPAKQFGSPRSGRITCHLVEGGAVNNLHVPSITELNDTSRGQAH